MSKVFKLPKGTEVVSKKKSFKKIKSVAHDIWVKDFTLSDKFCKALIKKFEKHEGKLDGVTGSGLDKNIKDTKDLNLINFPEFQEECAVLQQAVCDGFREMLTLPEFKLIRQQDEKRHGKDTFVQNMEGNLFCENDGYQLQRYDEGGKYIYHHEQGFQSLRNSRRTLTYSFYLNDDFEGGHTHFPRQGVAVQPKRGRLVLFDSSWSNTHAGMQITKGKKYFLTGWCLGNMGITPEEGQHIHAQVDAQQRQQFLEWQRQQNGKTAQ